jgi:hypothetical protein
MKKVFGFFLWMAFSVFIALALCCIFGSLQQWISAFSLIFGFALAFWFSKKIDFPEREKWPFHLVIIYTFLILVFYYHGIHLYFTSQAQLWSLDPNNLGDLPFHIAIFRGLARGASFWPENPIFSHWPLTYPYAIDFWNALWESLHVPTISHLFVTFFVCSVLTLIVLDFVGGFFLVSAFFFACGLSMSQEALGWKSFFLAIWIPQRGFLYAIPVGIFIFYRLRQVFLERAVLSKFEVFAYGFLWASLAFFHLHSFFILTIILGSFFLAATFQERKLQKSNLQILVPPFILGIFFVLRSTNFFHMESFLHFRSLWTYSGGGPIAALEYLTKNFYWLLFFLPLALFGNTQNRKEIYFYVFLFFAFCIVILAPWEWDNIKILIWPYLALSFMVSQTLNRYNIEKAIWVIVIFVPGISFLSQSLQIQKKVSLFSKEELNTYGDFLQAASPDARFLASPDYSSPVLYYGHKLFMGYDGHLWSHGIPYGKREKEVRDFYTLGNFAHTYTKDEKLDFLILSKRERQKYGNIDLPWRREFPLVYQNDTLEIYATNISSQP